jgi:hypothetical protein
MQEFHLSDASLPVGGVVLIAGITLLFHQAIRIRRLKRGKIHVEFSFRMLSVRSLYPAAIMIATGVLLLGMRLFPSGH